MSVLILIALGVCFSTSILFLVLYLKMKKKYVETDSNLQNTHSNLTIITSKYSSLTDIFNNFKKELSLNFRKGYYEYTLSILSMEERKNGLPGEPYKGILHVKEIDKYTNGMSKIELIDIEIISGYDSSQYDYVKKSMKTKFSSLKKTSEIEWLESEENIKELRRQKLKKISEIAQDSI